MAARVEWSAAATVPVDHPCLAGHFPGRPIVPAVLLIDLAVAEILQRYPLLQLSCVGTAKFLRPVQPAQPLVLHLSIDADSGQSRFRCALADGDAAVGDLLFITAATAG
jgi:3-hydroxymyristoyl/3-hydroxydecanoyl-(acyl carrier protein) dehydratase